MITPRLPSETYMWAFVEHALFHAHKQGYDTVYANLFLGVSKALNTVGNNAYSLKIERDKKTANITVLDICGNVIATHIEEVEYPKGYDFSGITLLLEETDSHSDAIEHEVSKVYRPNFYDLRSKGYSIQQCLIATSIVLDFALLTTDKRSLSEINLNQAWAYTPAIHPNTAMIILERKLFLLTDVSEILSHYVHTHGHSHGLFFMPLNATNKQRKQSVYSHVVEMIISVHTKIATLSMMLDKRNFDNGDLG